MNRKIYPREKYLSKIRPFYNSDIIKVITGIRRCGKSSLILSIIKELKVSGIKETDIIYIPLDTRGYKNIKTPQQLEERIDSMIKDDRHKYLFIDEVQNVSKFESVIQAYAEENYSIFLTGSNSYLLSDEISTKLTGRYLCFEVFTLDFSEYLQMKKFFNLPIKTDIDEEFKEYIWNGGFPKSLEFEKTEDRQTYTKGIIKEIFEKDVKKRKRISNVNVYERVEAFLINNYSSAFSLNNLLQYFRKESISTKPTTIRGYIEYLKKAKIVYECNRFDLKSKQALRREQKYYLADMSIYFSKNTDNRLNYGPTLENLVYLYLISNDYEVSIGKIGNFECDFIVRKKNQEYAYIQVTYTLHGENKEKETKMKEREYRPFRSIKDGYPRYIISLDRYLDLQEGVHHINAIDLFLGKHQI